MATPTGRNNTIIWIAVAVIVILGLAYWGGLFGQRTATETTTTTPPAAEQPTPPAATEQPTPPPATEQPSPAPAQPTPVP
ncbi:MAG: hypothetical protein AB7S41_00265 [Parvibaculaceae bacterium]